MCGDITSIAPGVIPSWKRTVQWQQPRGTGLHALPHSFKVCNMQLFVITDMHGAYVLCKWRGPNSPLKRHAQNANKAVRETTSVRQLKGKERNEWWRKYSHDGRRPALERFLAIFMSTTIAVTNDEHQVLEINHTSWLLWPTKNSEHDWLTPLCVPFCILTARARDALEEVRQPHEKMGPIEVNRLDFVGHDSGEHKWGCSHSELPIVVTCRPASLCDLRLEASASIHILILKPHWHRRSWYFRLSIFRCGLSCSLQHIIVIISNQSKFIVHVLDFCINTLKNDVIFVLVIVAK